jgi:aminopeptidase
VSVDPRLEQYAKLLVDDCVGVQPGWQVLVIAQPLARPLYQEVVRQIARRGAYVLPRINYSEMGVDPVWLNEAPEELLREVPSIQRFELENIDCYIALLAPENTREGADIPQERIALVQEAFRPLSEPFMAYEKPWVGCQYPTNALAQEAGMSLGAFEEFLYGSVLIDWPALERDMEKIKERLDRADEVRIVAVGTDLLLSLAGREGTVSGARANMPSGEVFYGPIEDSAEGVIEFGEFPATYLGRKMDGIRLVFEDGRVTEASARSNEDFLIQVLDTDEGARRVGEFGIGCNPGIQQYMNNTLFDEKIEGTVHLALGRSYPFTGGTNTSAIHLDIVKELRQGGRLECDGEVVQENGRWMLERDASKV